MNLNELSSLLSEKKFDVVENAVKDALVREGVPATNIAVIGRGEQGLLVQTGPNVREPQNRRVEIVLR